MSLIITKADSTPILLHPDSDFPQEIIDFFENRTRRHIELVQKHAAIIGEQFPTLKDALWRVAADHDASKWSEEEYRPYVAMTAVLNLDGKYGYGPGMEELTEEAWQHHRSVNDHHPPDDSSLMSVLQLAHMMSDWAAMSDEFENSLRGYVRENVFQDNKHNFNGEQRNLIVRLGECTGVW